MMPTENVQSLKDETVEEISTTNMGDNEYDDDEDLKDELEYITKDPIRKYQLTYNKSLCMSHKYPEVNVEDPAKDVELAPDEGNFPKDIMLEKDWDVKAYPHLHNPDGSNGKDQERRVRLTDQNYFMYTAYCQQRSKICKEPSIYILCCSLH